MIANVAAELVQLHRRLPAVLGIALSFVAAWPYGGESDQRSLIPFEIEDQFDREHTDAELRGEMLLFVVSDKCGSRYQARWIKALETLWVDAATPGSRVVEVADLRGVPFFMKRPVKRKFPADRRQWVLMDWKAVFATTYGLEPDSCNILLFDRGGELLRREAVRELDRTVLERIGRAIEAQPAMPGGPSGQSD